MFTKRFLQNKHRPFVDLIIGIYLKYSGMNQVITQLFSFATVGKYKKEINDNILSYWNYF